MAVIAKGVEVKRSTIIEADRGLFASRSFLKNEFITEYDGDVIGAEVATRRLARNGPGHLKTLLSKFAVIDGNISPLPGRGGGSFANDIGFSVSRGEYDRKETRYNAVYAHRMVTFQGERRSQRTGMAVLGAVWLKATRNIEADEEIFVSYGKNYWTQIKNF